MLPGDSRTRIVCANMRREGGRILFRDKGGAITYSGHGRTYRFSFELAVPGILLYLPQELAALPEHDRKAVMGELNEWLAKIGYAPKPPEMLKEEDSSLRCLFKGCERPRLKGRYYCRHHHDAQATGFENTLHYLET